jgi:hypothetical protein
VTPERPPRGLARVYHAAFSAFGAGLLTLLIRFPLVIAALIFTGGTLVFTAATPLMAHLNQIRGSVPPPGGRWFYLSGFAYPLLGIIVGTGLWLSRGLGLWRLVTSYV